MAPVLEMCQALVQKFCSTWCVTAFLIPYHTVELKVLFITHNREGQILRDKRAEHGYNPNADEKKNSAGQDSDIFYSSSI